MQDTNLLYEVLSERVDELEGRAVRLLESDPDQETVRAHCARVALDMLALARVELAGVVA